MSFAFTKTMSLLADSNGSASNIEVLLTSCTLKNTSVVTPRDVIDWVNI